MKKLKGLGNRAYNVMFHTHTVAGIVISFALFVIFYAGSFTLFYHEIIQWENHDMRQELVADADLDRALDKLDSTYTLDHTKRVNVYFPNEHEPLIKIYAQERTSDSTTEFLGAYYNPLNDSLYDRTEAKTTVGNTLYGLHYFSQIPVVGLYLAGLVGLFFLFASVTGVLVHWRNLLTKFYGFVKEGKWKQIWTHAHTVLGVIGLPFQIIYAITGAYFGLTILLLLPVVFLMYDGKVENVYSKIIPFYGVEVDAEAPFSENLSIMELSHRISAEYPDHKFYRAQVYNYGKEDAIILFAMDDQKGIQSGGSIVMDMKDGKIREEYSQFPQERTYTIAVISYLTKLHFANFGGFFMKVVYFILSMITCFMIISGVLLWRTARDNKRYTYKQRLFHHRVTKVYLAICLSMFPAVALLFITNKLVPMEMVERTGLVEQIFFLSWLALTILGLFWNKYSEQNRNYLILGGLLSLCIPIANGAVTGDWIWKVWDTLPWVAYVDIFWIFAGFTALYLSFFVLKVKEGSDKPQAEGEQEKVREKSLKYPTAKDLVLKAKSVFF